METPDVPSASMTRRLFRQEALRRYAQANNQAVLPRFTTPFATACCWALVCLVGATALLAWVVPIPMMETGKAIIIMSNAPADDARTVLLIFPPGVGAEVDSGDDLTLRFGTYVETVPLTSTLAETPRSAVVRIESLPPAGINQLRPGAIGTVAIEVGTRPVAAAMPFIGRFFS